MALRRVIGTAEKDSYTYLILLTSFEAREFVLASMDAGADGYVTKPPDPFTLHTRLIVAQRVTSLHTELAGFGRMLAEQARTDPLTDLSTRLSLTADHQLLHSRSEWYGLDYSLAMCDVDNFKNYNDTYGHQAGREPLKEVAVAVSLAGQVRQSDGIYRYGGEDFLFLLPDQSRSGAKALMECARPAVENLGMTHPGDPSGVRTIGAGISTYRPGHRIDSSERLTETDAALYMAKTTGRNKISFSDAFHA